MNLNGTIVLVKTNALNNDTDGDGLNDYYERNTSQTDPREKDSDGDSLSDYDEWMVYSTNPWYVDSDGDKLLDNEELSYNTNPNLIDSDSDNLNDYEELNGMQVTYFDSVNNEFRVVTLYSNPVLPDSDLDGIPDGTEVNTYGSNPLMVDTDRDGLTDSVEISVYFTSPINPDSDQDLLSDYIEIYGFDFTGLTLISPSEYSKSLLRRAPTVGINSPPPTQAFYQELSSWSSTYELQYNELSTALIFKGWVRFDALQLRLNQTASGWVTNPLNPDTDNDDVIDGLNPDTDNDDVIDGYEYAIGTNPRDPDSDDDKLTEGQELMITSGYGTDPLDPDTDSDGLSDWEEVNGNLTTLNQTYIFTPTLPLFNDSDGDGLSDRAEIVSYGTDAMNWDSDSDSLSDGAEIFQYSTNPLSNDTDSDGLADDTEINTYKTNALNNDTDGDGFLDGYEILHPPLDPLDPDYDNDGIPDGMESSYGLHWSNPDSNGNGILDGKEHDYDHDGLSDYDEMYTTHSSLALVDSDFDGLNDSYETSLWLLLGFDPGSDIDNDGSPNLLDDDSDNDLLTDYNETYLTYTNPGLYDTDFDLLSDYYEWMNGYNATNPDIDSDGILDGVEILYYYSDPFNGDENSNSILDGKEHDYDNDTLSDWDELYTYHTSQILVDTDADNVPDNVEISLGADPTDSSDFPLPSISSLSYPTSVSIGTSSVEISISILSQVNLQSVLIYWEFDNNGTIFSQTVTLEGTSWVISLNLPSNWNKLSFWFDITDIYNHTFHSTNYTINSYHLVREYVPVQFVSLLLFGFSIVATLIFNRKKRWIQLFN
ncbi:MAG: hypothetical protein ACTSSG_01080 [Candidatus Heimdallarchaeaceae archaeon]